MEVPSYVGAAGINWPCCCDCDCDSGCHCSCSEECDCECEAPTDPWLPMPYDAATAFALAEATDAVQLITQMANVLGIVT